MYSQCYTFVQLVVNNQLPEVAYHEYRQLKTFIFFIRMLSSLSLDLTVGWYLLLLLVFICVLAPFMPGLLICRQRIISEWLHQLRMTGIFPMLLIFSVAIVCLGLAAAFAGNG